MKKILAVIMTVMLAVVVVAGQSAGNVSAAVETNTETNTIETSATGQIEVAPDIAYVNAEISIVDESKSKASDTNKTSTAALLKALAEAGIPAKDIKTTGYYVSSFIDRIPVDPAAANPVYKEVKKYQVRSTFKITIRKLDQAGDVLESMTNVDNVDISRITYALSNITPYKKEAINKAVANAKENLSFAAASAGVKLSKLKSMTVDFNDNPYTPMPYYAKAESSAAVYQNPEDIKLSATVHMVYSIK